MERSATVCLIIYWKYFPLSLHPRPRIEYTTWQWDFWEFSKRKIGEELLENGIFSIFQKRKNWKTNGMLGNFSERKIGEKKVGKRDVGSFAEGADTEIFENIIYCASAAPLSKTLLLLLVHCRWICRGWAVFFSCSRVASSSPPPCKSPAFSPIKFHIFPAAK